MRLLGAQMEPRVKKLFNVIEEEIDEVPDAVVLVNGTDPMVDMTFYYMTRMGVGMFEGGVAVLYPDGNIDVLTSLLEAETASKGSFGLHVFKTTEERKEMLTSLLKDKASIGINANELAHSNYNMIVDVAPDDSVIVDVSKCVSNTRAIKDEDEINTLRKACTMASEVAEEIVAFLKEGVVEYEVAAEMCYMMQKKGASGPAFDTIVAFGKNSAEPHYTAGDCVLKHGEIVLMDFGAQYKRYRSDITRTYFCGEPSAKQKRMYEVVAEAQRLALEAIKAGAMASEPHIVAADYIDSTEFKGLFTHGLGHGLGLATHDGGGLSPRGTEVELKEGMVLTVEPGVYVPGFGGVRIEDDIVVRKDGYEMLTNAGRGIVVV